MPRDFFMDEATHIFEVMPGSISLSDIKKMPPDVFDKWIDKSVEIAKKQNNGRNRI